MIRARLPRPDRPPAGYMVIYDSHRDKILIFGDIDPETFQILKHPTQGPIATAEGTPGHAGHAWKLTGSDLAWCRDYPPNARTELTRARTYHGTPQRIPEPAAPATTPAEATTRPQEARKAQEATNTTTDARSAYNARRAALIERIKRV